MKRLLRVPVFLLSLSAFFYGCRTVPVQDEENGGRTVITAPELPEIAESRTLIETGSPDTLISAVDLLGTSGAGNSRAGEELLYISENLLTLVYPETGYAPTVRIQPTDSLFPRLFQDVAAGIFSPLLEEWNDFLELAVGSCAALFSDDPETLILSGIAAQAAFNINQNSVLPPYILGIISSKEGRYDDALLFFENALAIDSSCYPAAWNKAGILTAQGRSAEAIPILKDLVNRFPARIEYALELAENYLAVDEVEAAFTLLDRMSASQADTGYYRYLRLLIEVYDRQGSYKTAMKVTEELYQQFPGDKALQELYGKMLFENDREAEGEALLEELLSWDGLSDETVSTLFHYYMDKGRFADARRLGDELPGKFSTRESRFALMELYVQLRDYRAALDAAGKIGEEYGDDPNYLVLYGEALIGAGEEQAARQVLREASENAESGGVRSRIMLLQSRIAGTYNERLELLQSALFENMQNVDVLIELSETYSRVGDYKKALRYLRQADALDRNNPSILRRIDELEALLGG